MTWMHWGLTFVYVTNGGYTYWKAVNNQIVFYQDYADLIRCAFCSLCGIVLIDILQDTNFQSIDIKEVFLIIILSIVFVYVWKITYSTTRLSNSGINTDFIWWIQVHKMVWAPVAIVGAINSYSMMFGHKRSINERMNGLFLLNVIFLIFHPLVNGDKVAYFRKNVTSDEKSRKNSA